jgi:type II secretory pathway pseudopilin PulG
MTALTASRRRAGVTMIELLITMTMLLAITGAAWSLFRSQSASFRGNTERYDMMQNARGALDQSQRVIRTMGAGVVNDQPVLVYGSNTVLAFNSDYVERDTVDMRWAAYFDPDVPSGEATTWDASTAAVIPNSSPAYTYPDTTYRLGNGAPSPAETHILYFALDGSTPRGDDYVLWQQINNGTPEIVARNILPHPSGKPFFEYLLRRTLPTGDTLMIASGALVPLIRQSLAGATSATDSANRVRPDSVRAVRINLRVTNGQAGTAERFRDVSTTIETPNNGVAMPNICGRAPYNPGSLTVTDTIPGSGRVWLDWTASVDQGAGEQDVRQYILWRRPQAATTWSDPLVVLRAESGQATYSAEISGNIPGTSYTFGVAAQDCTPAMSSMTTANHTMSVVP